MNQPKRPWIVEWRPWVNISGWTYANEIQWSWSWRCSVSTREAALKRLEGVITLERGEVRVRHKQHGEIARAWSGVVWEHMIRFW